MGVNGRAIIELFGGQTAVARILGTKQSTVSYWAKTDKIPVRWWSLLITAARERGIQLEVADFMGHRGPWPSVVAEVAEAPPGSPVAVAPSPEALPEASPQISNLPEVIPGTGGEFLFYQSDQGSVKVQVLVADETTWVSQGGMAEIFGVTVQNISQHLQNIIYRDNEVNESVIKKSLIPAPDGKTYETNLYNLDAIISVGYRVNSFEATQFRRWATSVLRSYLIKGYALDDERLKQGKQLFGRDYFDELLERIREIRASERRFYQKITDLFAQCSIDYDKESPIAHQFYAHIQDKLHFAISGHTAAELVVMRANAEKPHMGLQIWKNAQKGGKVTKLDVTVGKNYLNQEELESLNRLVSMYLDWAENFARRQIALTMKDWAQKLDGFLEFNAYDVLKGYGTVRRDVAERRAFAEYEKFRVIQDKEFKSDFDRIVDTIKTKNQLPKPPDV